MVHRQNYYSNSVNIHYYNNFLFYYLNQFFLSPLSFSPTLFNPQKKKRKKKNKSTQINLRTLSQIQLKINLKQNPTENSFEKTKSTQNPHQTYCRRCCWSLGGVLAVAIKEKVKIQTLLTQIGFVRVGSRVGFDLDLYANAENGLGGSFMKFFSVRNPNSQTYMESKIK